MDKSYAKSINHVVDFIQANLEEDLSLNQLSKIACFSEFHFNRIFKSEIGESVYQFIQRLRLEKAADLLRSSPERSITDIALSCGYSNSASFAKSFKKLFKMNASEWRNSAAISIETRSASALIEPETISYSQGSPVWTFQQDNSVRKVAIEDIPSYKVAYVRNVGPYQDNEDLFNTLFTKLFRWAGAREAIDDETFTLSIFHDNHEITDHQKLRIMAAIPVKDSIDASGEVGIMRTSGGKYGVCRFLLKSDQFNDAWRWMSSVWLENSGYEWDDRESFERCFGEKIINGLRFFEVDICIPVKAK